MKRHSQRERAGRDPSFEVLQHPNFGLIASRTMKQEISVVQATHFVVIWYDSPRKLILMAIIILTSEGYLRRLMCQTLLVTSPKTITFSYLLTEL